MNAADANYYFIGNLPYGNVSMSAVAFVQGPVDVDRLTSQLAAICDRVDRLKQVIRPSLLDILPPTWILDDAFDVSDHIEERPLPAGSTADMIMGEVDVIHSAAWNLTRPPWRITVLNSRDGGESAIVARFHHSLTDGANLIAIFAGLSDGKREGTETSLHTGAARSSRGSTSAMVATRPMSDVNRSATRTAGVRHSGGYRATVDAVRSLFSQTPYGEAPDSRRRSCIFRVPLHEWRGAAHERGGGVNELLLAFAARVTGRYFEAVGVALPEVLVSMPVNRRDGTTTQDGGNVFGSALVRIPDQPGLTEDLSRIKQIAGAKRHEALVGTANLVDLGIRLLPGRLRGYTAFKRKSVVQAGTTNLIIPGSLSLGGSAISKMFVLPPAVASSLCISALTYQDSLHSCITTNEGYVRNWKMLKRVALETLEEFSVRPVEFHGR
ncbi:wax ester/triacylglycerol synthase domain-containing protein [Plantactinospora sp. DSM 117369]